MRLSAKRLLISVILPIGIFFLVAVYSLIPFFTPQALAVAVNCNEKTPTIVGTTGDDTLNGTSGNDVIYGDNGDDTINGNGGNDTICGGNGSDTITTEDGHDYIEGGGGGTDTIDAGAGNDILYGDTLDGGPGFDFCLRSDPHHHTILNCEASTDDAFLVIRKETIPDGSEEEFEFDSSDIEAFSLANGEEEALDFGEAGTFEIIEEEQEGWSLTNIDCNSEDIVVDLDNRTLEIALEEQDVVTCTFTNTQAAQITVIKEIEDGNDEQFDFEGPEDGDNFDIETEDGEGEYTTSVFPDAEGTDYVITESVLEGWDLTDIFCEGSDADIESPSASFTLEPGDEITCTFTNTQQGTLRIIKELIDYGEEDEEDTLEFPVTISDVGDYMVEVEPGGGQGSIDVSLPPGEYEVSEDDLPEGWMLQENGCEDVEVESGETTECTIVNKKQSRVVIQKTAIGNSDTFTFTGVGEEDIDVEADQEDGEGPNQYFGESFFDVFVDIEGEEFTVSEVLPEDTLWVQTEPEENCLIENLLPGETETCQFTNVKKATIIVMKDTTGGDGTFSIASSDERIGTFDLTTTDGTAEESFEILIYGETTVTFQEVDLPDEWVGSPDNCEVTVSPGETVICSLGNIKKARLLVEKETIGGDGTFSFQTNGFTADACDGEGEGEECNPYQFTLETERGSADTFFDIFVEGESLDVSIEESGQDEWQHIGDSICSVTLQPGEVATCTFTNAKAARLTVSKITIDGTGTFHFTGIGPEEGFDLTTESPNTAVDSFFDVFVDIDERTSFTIQEDPQENWTVDPESCTVTLHPGDEEECVFTNTFVPRAQISAQENSGVEEDGFTVHWTTDKPATSRVIYDTVSHPDLGAAPNYGYASSTLETDTDPKVTSHSVTVGGLSSGTTYYYRTVSTASPASVGSEQTVTTSASSIPSGGGGHGHGSRTTHAKAEFLANFHGVGDLPPSAFGAGPEIPLENDEIEYICSMQRALPVVPTPGLVDMIGTTMATLMGRDPAFIIEQLQDPFLCEAVNTALNTSPKTFVERSLSFPVATDGFPLSRNPTWNACIRGEVTLPIVRSNPDRDEDGIPRDCSAYHTSNLWRHPDLNIYFTLQESPFKILLPAGYVLLQSYSRG